MKKEQAKKNPRDASMTTKQDDNTLKSLELSEGQLEVHFRRLNLAHTRRIYKEVADRAEKESWSYRDFLALLLAEEVARRKQTRLQRCTRSAHFPFFKTIDEFDFTLQSTLRESVIGSYLGLDFVTEGRSVILHGKAGRGKTHLAVAIGYRAIQNGFETLFTTAAELIEDLSNASKRGNLQESLATYTHPHALIIDEVGYLTYGPDAANVLFHVVNDRHLRKRPMIFTTNKPLNEWGKVLHDEDMAAAILDRVLERGRFIHLDKPSGRTRHLNPEENLPENTKRLRISGIDGSDFPEPTLVRGLGERHQRRLAPDDSPEVYKFKYCKSWYVSVQRGYKECSILNIGGGEFCLSNVSDDLCLFQFQRERSERDVNLPPDSTVNDLGNFGSTSRPLWRRARTVDGK
ncbi:MAG: IS21-like element helper ATPase IstB, partial [Candidatus Acidiferrales bacterium]